MRSKFKYLVFFLLFIGCTQPEIPNPGLSVTEGIVFQKEKDNLGRYWISISNNSDIGHHTVSLEEFDKIQYGQRIWFSNEGVCVQRGRKWWFLLEENKQIPKIFTP